MSKFNKTATRPAVQSPIQTERLASGLTHEGATGFARDAKSELFLLAVANMVAEDTFYEKAGHRDERYERIIAQVAVADPDWTGRFLRWLRTEANMRSASLVGAAEAVRARIAIGPSSTDQHWNGSMVAHFTNRRMIEAVLQRPDEPGEMLAYWTSHYGRAIPKPVKRGVSDAVARLYSEYALLKYDTDSKGFRFADVIDLVHPSPAMDKPWQGDLFACALARRHNRDEPCRESLRMLAANAALRRAAAENPAAMLDAAALRAAGMTWEDALSLVGSKVDKAALWTALIPTMGLMALARNLRNFDEAGVSDEVADTVAARFADVEQVARSRMFPFRWLAAYRHAPSLRWGHALEKALTASLANVPKLAGRTLVLVDQSPSMFPGYYFSTPNKSDITLADKAKIFGTAVALRAESADLVQYGQTSDLVQFGKAESLLKVLDRFKMIEGTATFAAASRWYAGHDRVVIVTDEQTTAGHDPIPANIPVYTWNLGGYRHGHSPSGLGTRHTFGGLTDAAFRLIPLLEAHGRADWPF